MSVESLCQDDVTFYAMTTATDEQFGVVETYTAETPSRKAFVQEMNAATRRQYDIPAETIAYMLFFPADPGDVIAKRIGYGSMFLRPLGRVERHNPGRSLQLWAVPAEFVGNRQEAA